MKFCESCDGQDTVTYIRSSSGLTINLIWGGASTGEAAGDTFSSIEMVIGSNFNDGIFGDDNTTTLHGMAGLDTSHKVYRLICYKFKTNWLVASRPRCPQC